MGDGDWTRTSLFYVTILRRFDLGSPCQRGLVVLLNADSGFAYHLAHPGDLGLHHGAQLLRRAADRFHSEIEDLFPGTRTIEKMQYLLVQPRDDGARRRRGGERGE